MTDLFRELKQRVGETEFASDEAIKTHVTEFFKSTPNSFKASGIENLSIRWRSVGEAKGEFIVNWSDLVLETRMFKVDFKMMPKFSKQPETPSGILVVPRPTLDGGHHPMLPIQASRPAALAAAIITS